MNLQYFLWVATRLIKCSTQLQWLIKYPVVYILSMLQVRQYYAETLRFIYVCWIAISFLDEMKSSYFPAVPTSSCNVMKHLLRLLLTCCREIILHQLTYNGLLIWLDWVGEGGCMTISSTTSWRFTSYHGWLAQFVTCYRSFRDILDSPSAVYLGLTNIPFALVLFHFPNCTAWTSSTQCSLCSHAL